MREIVQGHLDAGIRVREEPLVGVVISSLPPGLRETLDLPGLPPPPFFLDVKVSLEDPKAEDEPEENHDECHERHLEQRKESEDQAGQRGREKDESRCQEAEVEGADQFVVASAGAGPNAPLLLRVRVHSFARPGVPVVVRPVKRSSERFVLGPHGINLICRHAAATVPCQPRQATKTRRRPYSQLPRIPAIAACSAGVTHSWYFAFTAVWRATYSQRNALFGGSHVAVLEPPATCVT